MSSSALGRVRVVPVAHKVLLQTSGVDGSEVVLDLDLPQVEEWGPHLLAITAHTLLEQKTANFQWRVVLYWSIDGITWSTATGLFANSAAAGQVIHPDFNDKTKLGLRIRLGLACSPATGQAREQGVVTVALAFDFRT